MEASRDNVIHDVSLLDSSAVDLANNTSDSNSAVALNTNSCISSNTAAQLSDVKNPSEPLSDSAQKAQTPVTTISNEKFESGKSSINGDVNNSTVSENIKNNVFNRSEKSENTEGTGGIKEMYSDLIKKADKTLIINSKLETTNVTNVEGCTSEKITLPENVRNATVSCDSIMEQFKNKEIIDECKENVTKDIHSITNNNSVEAMITDDQLDSNQAHIQGSVNANNMTVPDNNCNNIPACNVDQSLNQEMINKVEEKNDNAHCSIESIEPMVTDDPPETRKVINEVPNDVENHIIISNGTDERRDATVVAAMNENLSWKTDKVYQKDLRSLKLLCDYGSDSEEDEDNGETKKEVDNSPVTLSSIPAVNPCPAVHQEYREPEVVSVSDSEEESDSSDESSSTSSATSSSSSDESDDSVQECVVIEEKASKTIPKTKGELGLEDLPLIEDLHITVPESECVEIGKVLSIVDSLVVVQSLKGCPALDLDSVLFLDHGHTALGEVFDVFGKVGEACYCVRFNSKDHALKKGVEMGMPVYYAPRTEYSKYVFLADLTKMKGSDASWAHNNEPPQKFLDYSDDEQERRAKKGGKPPVRNVEREETQPQTKRFNRRGPNRGGGHTAPTSPRSKQSWATSFNRYHMEASAAPSPSPSSSPCPSPAPKPLIRPSSFRNSGPPPPHDHDNNGSFGPSSRSPQHHFQPLMQPPSFGTSGHPQSHFHDNSAMGGPGSSAQFRPQSFMPSSPQSHFHNAAAGAPPVSGAPSPWMVPPQFTREDFMNIPPPQPPFVHNQMRPNSFNMSDGGYRQPPPSQQSQFPPASVMRPTSIPNPGLFAVEPNNGFKDEAPTFIPNQPPSLRQDFHGSYGGGPEGPFGPQQPVFMNPNVLPPHPPSHLSPSSQHPHSGW